MEEIRQLSVGAVAFASTNIDDLVLLAALFADPALRPRSIVAGQFAGIAALVALSALGAFAAVAIPERTIALLGIVPLALGVRGLARPWGAASPPDVEKLPGAPSSGPSAVAQVLAVAALTIANGADNLGVYIPLFANSAATVPAHAVLFMGLTGLWCWIGRCLVHHVRLGYAIQRTGRRALPLVLIALGIYILSGVARSGH